ncbi:NDP-hexose 2,3-dehydratase family protein [Streptomyces indicus]|uniref:Oxidase EvaA n=1 Tax=Streptomyces indicus TaxID=417292 RepID=A0A1G9JRR4_9ACTN|nr:NDP-hexose 2,3-dehydratase family protein [Streptomyces indicus]SDL39623.1 oxidase EvaA [Streptomyces indicus]
MPSHVLQRRTVSSLPARIAASAATTDGAHLPTKHFDNWLAERRKAHVFQVDRIPFAEMDGWSFQEHTGNLVHHSGRFFTVEGLHFTEDGQPHGDGPHRDWYQPIMRQHEVGILGILAKELDGVLHFLMQAKMEPGNPNLLQLSPTVQATRSNYTKAHQGGDVKYIDHFVGPDRGQVIVDVRQSEHGSWFFQKTNRNMVVETTGDVPLLDDFCWLTLGQINELLHRDNVINMDSRTVLSCLPAGDTSHDALLRDTELLSWITGERTRHCVRTEQAPLHHLPGWKRHASAIEHETGRYFNVVAVSAHAENREVTGWTQPLFEPAGPGILALLTREIEGTPHVLVQARVEPGLRDTIELGPTVQYTPHNHDPQAEHHPPFAESVLRAPADRIRYDVVHAEEGGRFLNAESRCLIVDTDAPLDPPPGYAWATPQQLTSLSQHSHYLNVQARTMLACLNATKTTTP